VRNFEPESPHARSAFSSAARIDFAVSGFFLVRAAMRATIESAALTEICCDTTVLTSMENASGMGRSWHGPTSAISRSNVG
jgi:hypothetical protein